MGCPYTGPLKLTLSWHRTLQRETDVTRFDSWKKGGNRPNMGDETRALRPDNKWWKLGAQMAHEDSTINHSTTLEGVLIRMWIWINRPKNEVASRTNTIRRSYSTMKNCQTFWKVWQFAWCNNQPLEIQQPVWEQKHIGIEFASTDRISRLNNQPGMYTTIDLT